MSSNIWQMRKQGALFEHGKTTTSRINSYVKTWESRCYSDGIPDDAPKRLADQMRVPSYKAIAECLLKNDLGLYGLGFQPEIKECYTAIKKLKASGESKQGSLL